MSGATKPPIRPYAEAAIAAEMRKDLIETIAIVLVVIWGRVFEVIDEETLSGLKTPSYTLSPSGGAVLSSRNVMITTSAFRLMSSCFVSLGCNRGLHTSAEGAFRYHRAPCCVVHADKIMFNVKKQTSPPVYRS